MLYHLPFLILLLPPSSSLPLLSLPPPPSLSLSLLLPTYGSLPAEGWRLTADAFSEERMEERGNQWLLFTRSSRSVLIISERSSAEPFHGKKTA